MDSMDVFARISELADADEGDFLVIKPAESVDPARPLYLLVHPGDAVQKRVDVVNCEDGQADEIIEYSMTCQERMAEDMRVIDGHDWDVVVLHRISSDYTFADDVDLDEGYVDAIRDQADSGNAVLWGDDLPAASGYILSELRADERPAVVLAGAWSDADWGCVTSVGRKLEAAGARVHLSNGTSISPDGSGAEWVPANGKIAAASLLDLAVAPAPAL